jgi:hypothetical protein
MLDVHPPEHGIHGVRDFFIHLLTITVGLLIALGLEQSVELLHHRNQRKEAEAMIRQEIKDNRDTDQKNMPALKDELTTMTKVMTVLEELSAGKKIPVLATKPKSLQFREPSMQDSAWRTANSTGVLNYMDYTEVEGYSQAYKEQDLLQSMEEQTANDYLQLLPILTPHATDITPEIAKAALPFARSAVGHLSGAYFISLGTIGAYDNVLK